MLFRRRPAVFLVALLILVATQLTACAAITVIAEPGADPAHVAMVQKTVDSYNEIVSKDMGATLDRDVRVFVCPDRDSYRVVLSRELGLSPAIAARNAKITIGFYAVRTSSVAVHFDIKGSTAERRAYKATAHELFHQLQYQLAGGKLANAYYWMREGTADLIGARVAEKNGYQSISKWQSDQLNTLRRSGKHASPQEVITADIERWTTLMEQEQHPYEVADLMVFHLMTRTGSGYRNFADYFRLLGQG
ncbi:MAG TPA: hypothetical protein VN521_07780, partial [Negativicutes bacterium]|nr:hypothetical protein [Negativicutes bacterium]